MILLRCIGFDLLFNCKNVICKFEVFTDLLHFFSIEQLITYVSGVNLSMFLKNVHKLRVSIFSVKYKQGETSTKFIAKKSLRKNSFNFRWMYKARCA